MNDYEPVIGPQGDLVWQAPDGELYEMSDADQHELRLLALEQTAASLQGQDDYDDEGEDEDELTDEELNQVILFGLENEDKKRNARLTSKEIERFAVHAYDHDEFPDEEDWEPHNLDENEGRRQWLSERMTDINNGDEPSNT